MCFVITLIPTQVATQDYPPLWGQMGPNCQVESICGHIFVRHYHILIIFDQMIANGDTKKLINPNDLD